MLISSCSLQDNLIVATAIPKITQQFDSLHDVGWYGSAYMCSTSASLLVYGRIYTFYPAKWVFMIAVSIFEAGSAICGSAPSSIALILGRAIAGLGTGGISSGMIIIIVLTVPLRIRPVLIGFAGAIYGIASVLGPILGGIFTSRLTWRWCFYINLPLGAAAIITIFFLLDVDPPKEQNVSRREKWLRLDPLGNLSSVPAVICLLLALEWGGSTYSWSSWRIILLLSLSGLLFLAFIAVERRVQDRALIPPRVFTQRAVLAGVAWTMCTSAGMMVMLYYLPIWFQAIKGVGAEQSGIMNLPLVLGTVFGSTVSGLLISAWGYYNPFMFGAVVFMSVGAGLLTTFVPSTGHSLWIAFQAIFGLGLGTGVQLANIAVQACLPVADVPVGAALLMFSQQLNGSVFLAIGQALFSNFLTRNLGAVQGIDAAEVIARGATAFRQIVPNPQLGAVLTAYNNAITKTFTLGVVMACVAVLPALAMEWKSVKQAK